MVKSLIAFILYICAWLSAAPRCSAREIFEASEIDRSIVKPLEGKQVLDQAVRRNGRVVIGQWGSGELAVPKGANLTSKYLVEVITVAWSAAMVAIDDDCCP
ncbi:uncharacterized protein AKAW2_70142A [Aspergillus luchuensis]|uniref:Uncharacterized protein n=1 Tax=Aspergillus kawachii TaxID=1069201 RepID=A0A7R8A200_ASPKA|nr:uncharacterized protein AKAW2_70142A [Aspergillus luchuensis]BCS03264.1 hypothetical protein AKAW2_70142A [Aspergillus luchuensis]BCS14897.1 hypothetical protein ALUC_70130A [Aspergillus luchuensis]